MTPPPTSRARSAGAVVARIAEASRRFAAGEVVDLVDLAKGVTTMAAQIDRNDSDGFHALMALRDELQRLAEVVDRQRHEARATISDIEQARRARHAYRGRR